MGTPTPAISRERTAAPPPDPTIFHITVRDLLEVGFKRKWSFLLVVLATLFAGVFWLFFIRDEVYQVSAKILVRIGHEQSTTAAVAGPPVMITGERMQDVNTEADILGSTDLIARLIDEFGLSKEQPKDPPPERLIARVKYHIKDQMSRFRDWREEQLIRFGLKERVDRRDMIIALFKGALDVKAEKNSNIITATLLVPMRKDAGKLLNTLLSHYQSFRLEMYRDDGTRDFFRSETGGSSAQLLDAEQELRAFEETGNISALEKQKELLLAEITALERGVQQAGIEVQEVREKLNRIESDISSPDPNFASIGAFPANSFPDQMLQQLAALEKEREVLRMTDLESSTRIKNNRNQFRVILGMIATNVRSVAAERQAVYDARLRDLTSVRRELAGLQESQTAWTALKRKARILEDNYLVNRRKLDETTVSVAMEKKKLGNVAIIQHAIDPVEPLGMGKVKVLCIVLFVALIAALSWIAIAEFFDHAVYTSDALEKRLGLRVLGVVPSGRVPRLSHQGYAHGD